LKRTAILLSTIGTLLLPIAWIGSKAVFSIDDRYLPSPLAVLRASIEIEPSLLVHTMYTAARLATGSFLGIILGITLGLLMHRLTAFAKLAMPSVQSIRAVPPLATIPFFLLWFGFSEIGRYLMVVAGIGFNIAVATYQIVEDVPEKYRVFFAGLQVSARKFILAFAMPRALEGLLPTIRFSVATATGLVIVSELLGSQVGLGYLIQSARSTFATHTIFLAAIVLGFLTAIADALVRLSWRFLLFWKDPRAVVPQP
jgi:ABC-type nitrate/sulfonate/bicarbonate transport system permease component